MMDLFLDNKPLTFEKLGMESRLSEDPNQWPTQILDSLYRQAPFSSDYSPKVVLRDVDSDRRYAMGQIELINKLAINQRDDATPPSSKGSQKALIPVVVRDGKLSPLDLLMSDGKVEPLTEDRLRKALFRPNLFEAVRKRPGDMSMIEQLYPPHRQYGGSRGPLVADAGGGGAAKTASAKPEFILDAIAPTIKEAHLTNLTQRLHDDVSLRAALMSNSAAAECLGKIAASQSMKKTAAPEYLRSVAHGIRPTVIQVQKLASGFRIKTANAEALIPTADDVDRKAAVGTLGGDLVAKVEGDGTTTITAEPAVKETLEDINIKVVGEFGLYKVKTQGENKELVGWVFPKVMDLDGTLLPLAAFSNGSESGLQENIAGIPLARQMDVLDSKPQGTGCFYYATSSGATALVPVKISGEAETPNGTEYMCETVMGEQCTLVKMPGLREISPIAEGRYGIPDSMGFMPLDNTVNLTSSPDEFIKQAAARAMPTAVRVITDGMTYSFEGETIDKIAHSIPTKFIDKDDAVFLGAILGESPTKLAHALDTMRSQGSQEIWFHAREVTPFRDKYAEAKSRAHEKLASLPRLRADLVKEAAPLEDPTAVDKILSVGFINPENVSIFVSYVPEFENCIKKLSELLLAVRLGLSGVDAGALQKSLVHLDKVVAGLKSLGSAPQA
jgi:hypothetical protein